MRANNNTSHHKSSPTKKIYSLQYLRGIAALMVLCCHWGGLYNGGQARMTLLGLAVEEPHSPKSFLNIALDIWNKIVEPTWVFNVGGGSGGVLIFFLISGFVIATSVERQSAIKFIIKRAFRLMPTLWLSILLWIAFNQILQHMQIADKMPFTPIRLASNALLISDWIWQGFYDTVLWTLHIEAKFYVLIVCLIICCRQLSLQNILGLAIFICLLTLPMSYLGTNDYDALLKFAHTENGRTWPFYFFSVIGSNARFLIYMLIGSVIFLWYENRITLGQSICSSLGLFAIFTTLQIIAPNGIDQIFYVGEAAKMLITFFAIVAYSKYSKQPLIPNTALPSKILNLLGEISYPLYLMHSIIGMSIIHAVHVRTENINLAIMIATIIILPASWLIHILVEKPCITASRKLANKFTD